MSFPRFELVFLRGCDRTGNNLKDVLRCAAMTILHSDGNRENAFSAKLACCNRRDLSNKSAIGQATRTNFYRLEKTRKRATRAYGIHQGPLGEDDWIAGSQIRGNHGHGDL